MLNLFLIMKEVLFVDSGDPWNPRPATVTKVMKMLEGVHRVLKPDGIYISISFGQVIYLCSKFIVLFLVRKPVVLIWIVVPQPHFRRPFFYAPQFTWSVEWSTFGDGFHYFFYTLKKVSPESRYYFVCSSRLISTFSLAESTIM